MYSMKEFRGRGNKVPSTSNVRIRRRRVAKTSLQPPGAVWIGRRVATGAGMNMMGLERNPCFCRRFIPVSQGLSDLQTNSLAVPVSVCSQKTDKIKPLKHGYYMCHLL
jgi:hypothetical protein